MRTDRAVTRPSREPVSMRPIVDTCENITFIAVGNISILYEPIWSDVAFTFVPV